MQAEVALNMVHAIRLPVSPAKKLALSVWADDGGTVVPGSGGEVVFQASQSPEWTLQIEADRRRARLTAPGKR